MASAPISRRRKAAYYAGLALMVLGFLVAFSTFLTALSLFDVAWEFAGSAARTASRGQAPAEDAITGFLGGLRGRMALVFVQPLAGTALIIAGVILRRVGSHGAAGSGIVLDPGRAREDVKAWSHMHGGVLRDTLDAAGLSLGGPGAAGAGADLPFDEKLRRLHKLRQDGLLTEAEYQKERREILDAN